MSEATKFDQSVLQQRLQEAFPAEVVADQLIDVVKGQSRKTTVRIEAVRDQETGEVLSYREVPVQVVMLTTPQDQLRGLMVLDILQGGKIGLAKAAEKARGLTARRYDKWVRVGGYDARIISSPVASQQLTTSAREAEAMELPLDPDILSGDRGE